MNREQLISDLLQRAGVPCHYKGFDCLKKAVLLVLEKPELIYSMHKKLYPAVAEACTDVPKDIDKCIRHAVIIAWKRTPIETLHAILGPGVRKKRMTNSEFIATLAERVRLELANKGA